MPKKVASKKAAPKTQKVDLTCIEFFLALNVCLTVFFGIMLGMFIDDISDRVKSISTKVFITDLRTMDINEDLATTKEYAYSSKLYSKALYEESYKKAAKK
jgi:hypothetical protein